MTGGVRARSRESRRLTALNGRDLRPSLSKLTRIPFDEPMSDKLIRTAEALYAQAGGDVRRSKSALG